MIDRGVYVYYWDGGLHWIDGTERAKRYFWPQISHDALNTLQLGRWALYVRDNHFNLEKVFWEDIW